MKSPAQSKLEALTRARGERAVASAVGISERALRRIRRGESAPRAKTLDSMKALGIEPGDWLTSAATTRRPKTAATTGSKPSKAKPTIKSAVSPNPVVPATPAPAPGASELDLSLAEAITLYRDSSASTTDRLKGANVACTALKANLSNLAARHIAEYSVFTELEETLTIALAPHPAAFTAVTAVLQEFAARPSDDAHDPAAPIIEIIALADRMLASADTTTRDRAGIVAVRTRASKLLEQVPDDPIDACDYGELRSRLIGALKATPAALADVARVFDPKPADEAPPLAPAAFNVNGHGYRDLCRKSGWRPREVNA